MTVRDMSRRPSKITVSSSCVFPVRGIVRPGRVCRRRGFHLRFSFLLVDDSVFRFRCESFPPGTVSRSANANRSKPLCFKTLARRVHSPADAIYRLIIEWSGQAPVACLTTHGSSQAAMMSWPLARIGAGREPATCERATFFVRKQVAKNFTNAVAEPAQTPDRCRRVGERLGA